jgi:hypothetical protein
VQLQAGIGGFADAGWAVMAISYDDVATIAAFAARHGITYPLLADEGSRYIRRLGLVNPDSGDHPEGLAYPGIFVLNRDGVIVERRFEERYRVRPSATTLEEEILGRRPAAGIEASAEAPGVRLRAWTGETAYLAFQRLLIRVSLEIEPGLHAYGSPVPDGYVPLELTIETEPEIEVRDFPLPTPTPFRMAGLDEAFVVHAGSVDVVIPVVVSRRPPGSQVVRIAASYQACGETFCLPPARIAVELEIPAAPPVGS